MEAEILRWLVPAAFATFGGAFLVLRLYGIGSFWWAGAFGLAGTGFGLAILPPGSHPALKGLVEDGFILVAFLCLTSGLWARFGRRAPPVPMVAIIAGGLAGVAVSLGLHGSVAGEAAAVLVACALFLALSAMGMWGRLRRPIDLALFAVVTGCALAVLLQGLALFLTETGELTLETWRSSSWAAFLQLVSIVVGTLFAVTILVALGLDAIEGMRLNSETDPLSGVLNRRGFDEAVRGFEGREKRAGAVLLVDVDRFKSINDEYGHAAGDLAIAGIGALLKTYVGRRGAVARIGGEEFAVLLWEESARNATAMAEAMRAALADIEWPAPLTTRRVTASIGVAALRRGESVSAAVQRADENLYRAKREGRNRVVGGDPALRLAAA